MIDFRYLDPNKEQTGDGYVYTDLDSIKQYYPDYETDDSKEWHRTYDADKKQEVYYWLQKAINEGDLDQAADIIESNPEAVAADENVPDEVKQEAEQILDTDDKRDDEVNKEELKKADWTFIEQPEETEHKATEITDDRIPSKSDSWKNSASNAKERETNLLKTSVKEKILAASKHWENDDSGDAYLPYKFKVSDEGKISVTAIGSSAKSLEQLDDAELKTVNEIL